MSIIGKIYEERDTQMQSKLDNIRELHMQGKRTRDKTYAEEDIEAIENKVTIEFKRERMLINKTQVLDLRNKAAQFNEAQAQKEKLLGDFQLKINKNLTTPQKIGKFSEDSVAFYLHK